MTTAQQAFDVASQLAERHWLVFTYVDDTRVVSGCHCGMKSDLDCHDGFGDDVVQHLLAVGAEAAL